MKKIILVFLLFGLLVSAGFAIPSGLLPVGVGAKYGAMAGAASSIVDDITCAYYNPAGIVKSGNMELKIGAGAATEGLSQLTSTLGNASDPAKFLSDNFSNVLNIGGGLNAIIGVNVAKIGLSLIPVASLSLNKPANTIAGTANAAASYDGVLTLGYTFGVPGLPAGLDIGANIKSANAIMASSTGAAAGLGFSSADNIMTYSGVGFDLGAKASLDIPVVPVSVAVVFKDISETLKGKVKSVNTTYDSTGKITNQNTVSDADGPDVTVPMTTVIGASTMIPGVGLKVAVDIDNVASSTNYYGGNPAYSLTHLGLEYPLLGIVALRAGTVSGGPGGAISQTTLGVGFNLGVNLNIAMMSDAKNSKNNATAIDFGFAF